MHIERGLRGNRRECRKRTHDFSTAANLAPLFPGLFSVVCKTLMFYVLFQRICFINAPNSTFRTVCLNLSRSALVRIQKIIAQAAGFLIEACQIPKADAFSFCSSWIRILLFGFKDKGNTYPIR